MALACAPRGEPLNSQFFRLWRARHNRRNWLFCSTEVGAEAVATVQSLIVTCRLHDIDPYVYLVDLLQRIDRHPASEVHLLIPRLWKQHFADNPLRSDLHDLRA